MSKAIFELEATVREDKGKGASRRLRREQGLVPGIVYGSKKEPVSITLSHNLVKRALEHEAFYSHILTLKIDGKSEKVVLRDLQRHPYKPFIQHMDFQRVSATQKLHMHVPLHFMNDAEAPGVKNAGGIMSHHVIEVEISCLPKDLPEFIEVDLGAMELNDILHLSDLKLPKGVELVDLSTGHHNDRAVASVHLPRKVEEEVVEEAAPEAEASAEDSEAPSEGTEE